MEWSVVRLNQEVKKHDRRLFVVKNGSGMRQIWRQADKWDAADLDGLTPIRSAPIQLILSLTDNWDASGKPVEWGIEPIMHKIMQMDSWQDDSIFSKIRKERERVKEDKERAKRNEIRAYAADNRRLFAKATNDINTSILDKTDNRRKKDGYSK